MNERFIVHVTNRNGSCTSHFGLTEQEALRKVESFYKRRRESRSVAEDGREAGASWKGWDGWTWYHEDFENGHAKNGRIPMEVKT